MLEEEYVYEDLKTPLKVTVEDPPHSRMFKELEQVIIGSTPLKIRSLLLQTNVRSVTVEFVNKTLTYSKDIED